MTLEISALSMAKLTRGIWFASTTINSVIEKNRIHDLGYTGTSGYGETVFTSQPQH